MMEARRQLLCNTPKCIYVKHPDKNNNGGTHCCRKCKSEGLDKHGQLCKKEKIAFMKCDRVACHFMKNPDVFNNGGTHCCSCCKEREKTHGPKCTAKIVGKFVADEKSTEPEMALIDLEEFQGVDFTKCGIFNLPCASLQEARTIAAREIGGNKNIFAAFCKKRKRIWIKREAAKNHPSVSKGRANPNITLFYNAKPKRNAQLMAARSNDQKEAEDFADLLAKGWKGGQEFLGKYRQKLEKLKETDTIKFHAFLSHAQADAQDVVGLIGWQLKVTYGLKVWLDMEAENLNVEGMLEGVDQSETFVLFATRNYFTRPFCVFELLVALELGKRVQIMWEPDIRHHGFNNFGEFMAMVPKEAASILEVEAIDYRRREPKKTVQLEMLANRLKGSMPITSWSAGEFLAWVVGLAPAFKQYAEVLKTEGIKGKDIVDGIYKEDDLVKLGISNAHAKKILSEVMDLIPG